MGQGDVGWGLHEETWELGVGGSEEQLYLCIRTTAVEEAGLSSGCPGIVKYLTDTYGFLTGTWYLVWGSQSGSQEHGLHLGTLTALEPLV